MSGKPKPLMEALLSKFDHGDPNACWIWTGALDPNGYGRFNGGAKCPTRSHLAHRIVYTVMVGPVSDGLDLDHLCRTPSCVNPAHLEPVTHRVNMLRGTTGSARNARKTKCDRGHDYTPDNTYVKPSTGHRECIACRRLVRGVRSAMVVAA